jgi:hypothetical protein
MAATSTCVTPIKGTHLRIVEVDSCGVPSPAPKGWSSSPRFVSVEMEPDYETARSSSRDRGRHPVRQPEGRPDTEADGADHQMCQVNVSGISYIMSARELIVGTPTPAPASPWRKAATNRFSLEV